MNFLAAWLKYQTARLGWQKIAGLVLLGSAIGFYRLGAMPAEARLHAMEQQLLQQRSTNAVKEAIRQPLSPQTQVQAFYGELLPEQEATDFLESMFDTALENDLALQQGELKLERQSDVAFSRYLIAFPVTGQYPDIRGFINQMMRAFPTLALDGIALSREDAKQPVLEARIRFSLYLGAPR